MKIRVFIALAAVFAAFGFAFNLQTTARANRAVFGGKCAIKPFETAYRQSKAVFVGEVVSDEKTGDVRVFEFKIEKYWKGTSGKRIKIHVYETMRYQSFFEKGEKYLIYADESDGKLNVSRCSRSRSIESAEEDLQKLGTGKIPR